MATHIWVTSTLGHGDAMCQRCKITNREAMALNKFNHCDYDVKQKIVCEDPNSNVVHVDFRKR
jgi:hypothetical protein